MEKIKIGTITAAQGLRGETRLFHDSGDEGALKRLTTLFLRKGADETAYPIEWMRMSKRTPIIKLEGIEDRDSAEALIGSEVRVLLSESQPDEEDVWLVTELVGLEVFTGEEGSAALGRVSALIDNPAHDILEITTEGGVRLLPLVDVFVPEVDTAKGRIVIAPPAGWFDN